MVLLSCARAGFFNPVKFFSIILLHLEVLAAGWRVLRSLPCPASRHIGKAALRCGSQVALHLSKSVAAAGQQNFTTKWAKTSFFERGEMQIASRGKFRHDTLKNDEFRTPLYFSAIRERVQDAGPGVLTFLDLGTGPFALMAIEAARAGAKRVYAIEADVASAELARKAVAAADFEEVIEIIQGFSTRVSLPEKVDVLVSEIVGSPASEEGLYATIADAHERHLKHPTDPRSWIPHRCQTVGAPATYIFQKAFGFWEWKSRQHQQKKEAEAAIMLHCDDRALIMLAPPAVLEDVRFTDPQTLLDVGHHALMPDVATFHIDESRLRSNEATIHEFLTNAGAAAEQADTDARLLARTFSGIGMWPRLELDPDGKIVVEARGKDGDHRRSSWGTLLPFASEQPLPIIYGSTVMAQLHIELSKGSSGTEADAPRYSLFTSVNSPDAGDGSRRE